MPYRFLPLLLSAVLLVPASAVGADYPAADPAGEAAPHIPADTADETARKIHAQLRAPAGSEAARLPAVLAAGEGVLVELRFRPDAGQPRAEQMLARAAAQVRNVLAPDRVEAWVARDQLYDLARDPDLISITPARLARRHIGSRTSEGVAAGRAQRWHAYTPALDGDGVTIAVIDAFDDSNGEINALQQSSSNNWPPDSRVAFLNYKSLPTPAPAGCSPNTFGCLGISHGNATTEIAYDTAPGADFRVYDTLTVGDWRRAILDAANLSATGSSLGSVRAQIVSASLGAPLDGKGDGTALPGSIAEAAGWARNRGVLVVNAAGNERLQHWDGLFTSASSNASLHTWSGSNTPYNPLVDEFGLELCIPAGNLITVDLYWNNWVAPGANHNYDLYLYRRATSSTWESLPVAQSTLLQNGASGQTPQEQLNFVSSGATSGCAANRAKYGVVVARVAGTTARDNLEVFANVPLQQRVTARSLGFPADSPNVLSVGAINVATAGSNPQEPFSSEGPVLATGGGLPTTTAPGDPNLKPDLVSFDNVSTISYGLGGANPPAATSFLGTSAATPHVAGMAALLMQRNGVPTAAAQLDTLIVTPLRTLAATGSNDLGATGRDYQYGYGRLRFALESALAFLQQPGNTPVGANITPAVKVQVLDDEGLLVPYGLLAAVGIALGNDPNGGSAALVNGGAASLVQGVATWSTLRVNLGGNGYTLRASGTGLPVATSAAFNITTGAPSRLAFDQQPATTQAGRPLPVLTVRVEDSNGNLVTTDNATQVRLTRSNCSAGPVEGGAPVTVVNGVATFAAVTLYTPGSNLRLQAVAAGRSSANSDNFNVTSNAELILHNGFETCLP